MPEPICIQCGIPLEAYAPQRFARCDGCFATLEKRPFALAASEGLLVRANYHPGFAEDLTTWHTEFFTDGRIKQSIRWYPDVHGQGRPPVLTGKLGADDVTRVSDALSAIDLSRLAVFKNWTCVDDAPFVHVFAPEFHVHVTVDQFGLDDQEIPKEAIEGLTSFQQAWELIDSLSPYTLATHFR